MGYIKQEFSKLNIHITEKTIKSIHALVIGWETRGTQPLCLNSQLIGVHTIVFTDHDRSALFQLFGLTEQTVRQTVAAIARFKDEHDKPIIDLARKVTSDPFNLLSTWLLHLALEQIPNEKLRHQFRLDVAKYLHYKYFTSLVNYHLPYGANESVMLAAITSMNRRFDLIVHGSWRLMIAARCEDLISTDQKKNIHAFTLDHMDIDPAILYVVTDPQTRIRDKVNGVCDIYYNFHKNGVKIESISSTGYDAEGEKILIQKASTIDTAVTSVATDLMSVNAFVKSQLVNDLCTQFNGVSPRLLRLALETMAQTAVMQVQSRKLDDVKTLPGGMFEYIGMRVLVREIINTSIEYCIKNKINLNSKIAVFNAIKNRYTSSQIKDERILSIKDSVGHFVDGLGATSRPATKASLRLTIIMYVLSKCLLVL